MMDDGSMYHHDDDVVVDKSLRLPISREIGSGRTAVFSLRKRMV